MNKEAGRRLVLVLRRGLSTLGDHVQAMLDLGTEVDLLTVDTEEVDLDPRFSSIRQLPPDASQDAFVRAAVELARRRRARAVVTFIEPDIEIAEAANAVLNVPGAAPEAALTSRDKLRQRRFLRKHDLPSVWFHPVGSADEALTVAADHGLPVIVKPTRAAASDLVELVWTAQRLKEVVQDIQNMIASRRNFYYPEPPTTLALLEDYLPGLEVTVDGVVLDGNFILGGVHDKAQSSGPHFDESLYTLPFATPEREAELVDIVSRVVAKLGVRTCMFNAELRSDAAGRFRVIEFSIRVSGGHVYRQIRDVHTIDLVRIFVRAMCGEPSAEILAQENRRRAPRMTVCTKAIYANGRVLRNSVGAAIHSPHLRAYYPVGRPGAEVVAGKGGFDFTGLLSVWYPWTPGQSPSVVHAVADDLATKLDLHVEGLDLHVAGEIDSRPGAPPGRS